MSFLDPANTSLKICGVTTSEDAHQLAQLHVHAIGVNFWEKSKRYCHPDTAREFLPTLAGKILRVGVFVNNSRPLATELLSENLLDVIQLHGDETPADISFFTSQNIPLIRALPAGSEITTSLLAARPTAILLDTPAGKNYGGTGQTFDWSQALDFKNNHPDIPLILAGGLNPENAAQAIIKTQPAAIDIASGAESTSGQKNFEKVQKILESIPRNH